MKDKSDNTNQADKTAAKTTEPKTTESPKVTPKVTPKQTKGLMGPFVLTIVAAVILGGGALWYIQKNQSHISQQYDAQFNSLVEQSKKNAQTANEALRLVQNQAQQIQRLNKDLSKANEELTDISTAVQTISDSGSDLILVNDIEQLVTLAQQQLMIGGNLANAIVSLETAQARLARANRQSLVPLMQSINGDLDRLRTVQVVDVSTVTAQLDRLKELLNQAPLYVPDSKNSSINGSANNESATQSVPNEASNNDAITPTETSDDPWWQRTLNEAADLTQKSWQSISHDLGQFVSVRRVDDSAALLMSPDQADRFRDNLNLRVTMAQLALMTKQTKVWQAEMTHIIEAIEKRFDSSLAVTQRALSLATQLADTQIDTKLPSLDNSLAAIENLKQADLQSFDEYETPNASATKEPSADPAQSKESDTPTRSTPEIESSSEDQTKDSITTSSIHLQTQSQEA